MCVGGLSDGVMVGEVGAVPNGIGIGAELEVPVHIIQHLKCHYCRYNYNHTTLL